MITSYIGYEKQNNVNYNNCKPYVDNNALYTVVKICEKEPTLCLKLMGRRLKNRYLSVYNYKKYTAEEIISEFSYIGEHIGEAINSFYKDKNLELCYNNNLAKQACSIPFKNRMV